MLELKEFMEFTEKASRLYLPKKYRRCSIKAVPFHTEDGQEQHRLIARGYNNKGTERILFALEPAYERYVADNGRDLLGVVRDEVRGAFQSKRNKK